MSGTVKAVHVDIGSRVRAGDRLITLDAQDVLARVEAARAGFALAEKSHGRIERLAADGAASAQELDRSFASLQAARSALAEAEAQEAYAVVRAPFDGVVTGRTVDAGDLANPGVPLLTVVDPGELKVEAELPARLVGSVEEGASVRVAVAGAAPVEAQVTRVVPAVSGGGRTFRVEARLDDASAEAYPGAYARLLLPTGGTGSLWIPSDAVVERGQMTGVYLVEGEALRLRWVRLGERRAGGVELLSGPSGELRVVRSPSLSLSDGQPVGSVRDEGWAFDASTSEEAVR